MTSNPHHRPSRQKAAGGRGEARKGEATVSIFGRVFDLPGISLMLLVIVLLMGPGWWLREQNPLDSSTQDADLLLLCLYWGTWAVWLILLAILFVAFSKPLRVHRAADPLGRSGAFPAHRGRVRPPAEHDLRERISSIRARSLRDGRVLARRPRRAGL